MILTKDNFTYHNSHNEFNEVTEISAEAENLFAGINYSYLRLPKLKVLSNSFASILASRDWHVSLDSITEIDSDLALSLTYCPRAGFSFPNLNKVSDEALRILVRSPNWDKIDFSDIIQEKYNLLKIQRIFQLLLDINSKINVLHFEFQGGGDNFEPFELIDFRLDELVSSNSSSSLIDIDTTKILDLVNKQMDFLLTFPIKSNNYPGCVGGESSQGIISFYLKKTLEEIYEEFDDFSFSVPLNFKGIIINYIKRSEYQYSSEIELN